MLDLNSSLHVRLRACGQTSVRACVRACVAPYWHDIDRVPEVRKQTCVRVGACVYACACALHMCLQTCAHIGGGGHTIAHQLQTTHGQTHILLTHTQGTISDESHQPPSLDESLLLTPVQSRTELLPSWLGCSTAQLQHVTEKT